MALDPIGNDSLPAKFAPGEFVVVKRVIREIDLVCVGFV